MKYVLAVGLFVTGFLPFFVFSSCAPSSPSINNEEADVVVLGKVREISDESFDFSVEKYFKGDGPFTLQISSSKYISTVDFRPSVRGGRYLLYLRKMQPSELIIPGCSGSRAVSGGLTIEETVVFYTSFLLPDTVQLILINDSTIGVIKFIWSLFIIVLPFTLFFGLGYGIHRILKQIKKKNPRSWLNKDL